MIDGVCKSEDNTVGECRGEAESRETERCPCQDTSDRVAHSCVLAPAPVLLLVLLLVLPLLLSMPAGVPHSGCALPTRRRVGVEVQIWTVKHGLLSPNTMALITSDCVIRQRVGVEVPVAQADACAGLRIPVGGGQPVRQIWTAKYGLPSNHITLITSDFVPCCVSGARPAQPAEETACRAGAVQVGAARAAVGETVMLRAYPLHAY